MSTYQMGTTKRWVCPKCGLPKDAKASLCKQCRGTERASNIPSEDKLKSKLDELHWNFSAAGRFYEVSDNTVRKWCKRYGLLDKKG